MAQRPKAKPKRKGPKNTDKKQSARFLEAARTLGIDDDKEFHDAIKKMAPPKQKK
jgi:hypothetical protein